MTLWMVVEITPTFPRLREMHKSWYEFSFMSCMCISMRQCGWLLLDDVDDLSYVSKICMNVYRRCGWLLFSNMVYVCGLSYMMCVCHLWILMCWWWYCLCGDKYSVCDYMNFCVVTCGGKHIRHHFWPLVGLTSVGTYDSRRKLWRQGGGVGWC
jgi:hypothetical protein